MSAGAEDVNDLAWPVTTGDCAVLIALSIAALVGMGLVAAWMLGNIVSLL